MSLLPPHPGLALEARQASLSLGGRRVLQALTLQVQEGERLAIVGPNGAGKSSLLHLLAARLPPDSGQVCLFGHDLARLPAPQRARLMSVLHQEVTPSPHLTVHDYVALGRIPHGTGGGLHEVDTALSRLGLSAWRERRLGQLSGGQRRLVALARALAQSPRVLLLDEPTNHLDLRTRIDVLDSVAALGITVVAVLHELSLVPRFAERVLVLHEGETMAHDTPVRALSPALVRQVFRMDVHRLRLPERAHEALVFDAPADARPFAAPVPDPA